MANFKHGYHGTRVYNSWQSMMARCHNPRCNSYQYYGGRDIKVCKRWHNFLNFFEDIGERPEGKTLDRYPDNNGNYKKSNCRWATPKEQQENNRRKSS